MVLPMTRVNLAFNGTKSIYDYIFNPGYQVVLERNIVFCQLGNLFLELISFEVLLKLFET